MAVTNTSTSNARRKYRTGLLNKVAFNTKCRAIASVHTIVITVCMAQLLKSCKPRGHGKNMASAKNSSAIKSIGIKRLRIVWESAAAVFTRILDGVDPDVPDKIRAQAKQTEGVKDVSEVRELLMNRGIEVSDVVEYPRGIKSAFFSDPDGNSWELQEIPPGI